MRIAIVNDSLLAVESLRRVVVSAPEHEIAWIAYNGAEAIANCLRDTPNLILMDLTMPIMDGVTATRQIMAQAPCAILVITATIQGNCARVFEAMGAGALDALNTPIVGADGQGSGKAELLRKIQAIGCLINGGNRQPAKGVETRPAPPATSGTQLLAIGASTGGPAAVVSLLAGLPQDFQGAVVLAQHMDEQFMDGFATWLGAQGARPVRLASSGDRPQSGIVLVAGGKDHLILRSDGTLGYTSEPSDYPFRPSVNALFESIATHWNGAALGVLLTGMGRDGADGLLAMRRKGYYTIAQDKASCAVYGMPRAAVEIGAAQDVLALDQIASCVSKAFAKMGYNKQTG
ncbi:MAG: chemotaxis-specific protein-glutamate methyltransferase CheB [Gammaproteobacteria bacterium]